MVILRFKIHSKPEKSDEVMAALAEIIAPARATEGVVEFDIARLLRDPDSFIAIAIYEDGAALERQESAPEVHRAMALFAESLAAPPERTIFDASLDPTLPSANRRSAARWLSARRCGGIRTAQTARRMRPCRQRSPRRSTVSR